MKSSRAFWAPLLAGILCLPPSPAAAQAPRPVAEAAISPVEGQWEGEAHPEKGWPLFLLLRFERGDLGLKGTLSVLGQNVDLGRVETEANGFKAQVGEGAEGLLLEGAVSNGKLAGRLVQNGATLPFALDRVPTYPKPANRLEAWSQDIDALKTRVPKADRSFSPGERAAFAEATESLERDLPSLTDQQIMVRMASAMALAHNAHTRLYLLRVRTQVRTLPIRLWWFSDGLRVVKTAPEYRAMLGCRVSDIAGVDARHARDIVAPIFAGNPGWRDYMSSYTLASSDVLNGAGITSSAEIADFGLADCPGAPPRMTVTALPLAKSNDSVEAWWDISPSYGPDGPWLQALKQKKAPTPLYLRNSDENYWHEYLPAGGILYFQYNRAADMKDESTADYAKRLLKAFDENKVKAFVLDLRFNTGGNGNLAEDLMKELRVRTGGMPRFVITGRSTFSAGISHAARWRELGDVTFVGEPVGDDMDFWSEGGNIILPNSGLAAHFANGAHSYSKAPCPDGLYCLDAGAPSLRPDIPASAAWKDYIAGRDPGMEAVLRKLGR